VEAFRAGPEPLKRRIFYENAAELYATKLS
jgi:hypothetical protein